MVLETMDELLQLAVAQGCSFPSDFKEKTLASMILPSEINSIMYQDFTARRPMEVETYLGSPIKLAQEVGLRVPRIETLYALLHNFNTVNQTRSTAAIASSPTVASGAPPRLLSVPPPRLPMNGGGMRGGRVPSGLGPPPQMRRGPPPSNGYPARPPNANGYPPRGPGLGQPSRRGSPEGNDLEEFSHLVLYNDDIPEGAVPDNANGAYVDRNNGLGPSASELALRERELMLRQRELQLREREYNMRRGSRKPTASHRGGFDDDDDDEDYVDPMARPVPPMVDPDNFDMMSVTSRRNRKTPSVGQLRKNPEMGPQTRQNHPFGGPRPGASRNRTSSRMAQDVPGLQDSLMENPMMAYSSNRYGTVDRKTMGDESRANSLTAARLDEFQQGGLNGTPGGYPTPSTARRTSQSPGNPYTGARAMNRPSPPNGNYMPPNGMQGSGRPSPPGMMRQPVPRYPPGHGNSVATQQVEQHAGVSTLYPPKGAPNVRSLTGSASASAGSGDSGASAHVDSENSAYSSQSSLGPRLPIGVR